MMQSVLATGFLLLIAILNLGEARAGGMIVSDTHPGLAISSLSGAQNGAYLGLVRGCSTTDPNCTWTYDRGMLVSDKDPSLAMTVDIGASHGATVKLAKCTPDEPYCTWSFRGGRLTIDADENLAINAYGGAYEGTVLRLVKFCPSDNPDCTWTFRHTTLFSGSERGLAVNAYGGAKNRTLLKLVSHCPSDNPDCTWTLRKGMVFSDRDMSLAVRADYRGPELGDVLVLSNNCQSNYPGCTWTFSKGVLAGTRWSGPTQGLSGLVSANGGAQPQHGSVLRLTDNCPSDNPNCTWSMGWPLCQTGRQRCFEMSPTGIVRELTIPATASAVVSDIEIKKGHQYRLEASGTIRVGVLFEGDTNPDGWTDQGPAGRAFPAPRVPKYALLVRIGESGEWASVYDAYRFSLMGAPEGSRMIFGINDDRLGDNSGQFLVKITEYGPFYPCKSGCSPLPHGSSGLGYSITTKPPDSVPPAPIRPCEGQTPDGRLGDFLFDVYCGSMFTYQIAGQGCTRQDALAFAKKLVSFGCFINEIAGTPVPYVPPVASNSPSCTEQLFKFCVTCDNGVGPFYSTPSYYACTEALAKKKVLDSRPSFCIPATWQGSCPRP